MKSFSLVNHKNNYIYFGKDFDEIAIKIFKNYYIKTKNERLNFILKDNNTNEQKDFLLLTKNKYDQYNNLIKKYYNDNQFGGEKSIIQSDDNYQNDISAIASTLNSAMSDMTRILQQRDVSLLSQREDKTIIVLNEIKEELIQSNQFLSELKDHFSPTIDKRTDKDKSNSNCIIM